MILDSVAEVIETITPTRNFNLLYIILDSIFIVFLCTMLVVKKRYLTLLFALFGGVLYFVVDYIGFHLLSHTRTVYLNGVECDELVTSMVLLWMSLSYGITNFAFIWLCVSKDKYLKEWLFMIVAWWICAPSIALLGGERNITTYRTTNAYHSYMAIVLIVMYFILVVHNLMTKKKMTNILWLNLIGISVQFGWEFSLLINGIRPMNENSITTLIVNSLIETNLGMPGCYLIYLAVSKFFNEDLSKKKAEPIEQIPASEEVETTGTAE